MVGGFLRGCDVGCADRAWRRDPRIDWVLEGPQSYSLRRPSDDPADPMNAYGFASIKDFFDALDRHGGGT